MGDGGPPLVLAAHMDTVWPTGTLMQMPFRVEGGYAHGPGALDMKAGIVTAIEAVRRAGSPAGPVCVLITADEEIGSPSGRPIVEELAREARAVLVLEPPVRDGTITTSRSGLARYQLRIRGRAAHAGNGWRAGVSAIEELAHQVAAVHALADEAAGMRTNVGQVGGGTGDNVVAAEAWARIDARAWTAQAQARLEAAIYGLEPRVEGATIEVSGAVTRPPMVQSEAGAALAGRDDRDRRRPRDRALRERVTRAAPTATSPRPSGRPSSTGSAPPARARTRSTSGCRSSRWRSGHRS